MTFGDHLKQKREERGVSLEDISSTTRVAVRYLHALEIGDFEALPGGVFNRGIVRSYARCIEMDEAQAIRSFDDACRSAGLPPLNEDWAEFAQNVSKQRGGQRKGSLLWLGVLVMLLILLVAGYAVYQYIQHR